MLGCGALEGAQAHPAASPSPGFLGGEAGGGPQRHRRMVRLREMERGTVSTEGVAGRGAGTPWVTGVDRSQRPGPPVSLPRSPGLKASVASPPGSSWNMSQRLRAQLLLEVTKNRQQMLAPSARRQAPTVPDGNHLSDLMCPADMDTAPFLFHRKPCLGVIQPGGGPAPAGALMSRGACATMR